MYMWVGGQWSMLDVFLGRALPHLLKEDLSLKLEAPQIWKTCCSMSPRIPFTSVSKNSAVTRRSLGILMWALGMRTQVLVVVPYVCHQPSLPGPFCFAYFFGRKGFISCYSFISLRSQSRNSGRAGTEPMQWPWSTAHWLVLLAFVMISRLTICFAMKSVVPSFSWCWLRLHFPHLAKFFFPTPRSVL